MRLRILHVPDCPNVDVLAGRLAQLLSGRQIVEREVVRDLDDAVRLGMNGSPTLLIDEQDPFAGPELRPSLACRLYVDEDGVLTGAPSLSQLGKVIPQQINQSA